MQQNIASKLNFRYDLNALRALAVLGVTFFHYKIPYFNGGFSGVDIFFVISGYLMTRIIINGINKQNFSIISFYERRLERIVPALLCLILILTIAGFFFYLPEDFKLNQKNAAGSILFISNILYWKNSSYFDPASDTNIFLHTWSLSVEWQFYLLYPIVVYLLSKFFKTNRSFLIILLIATVIIAILSIRLTAINSTASFYLFPTRSWEMLFGGLAFLLENVIRNYRIRVIAVAIGYLSLCCSIVFLKSSLMWPGLYTFLPVVSTFVIIVGGIDDFKFLKYRPVQFLGKISYSIYLWHWPVWVFAQYLGVQEGFLTAFFFFVISLFLGYLSYNYIERIKFRSKGLLISMCVLCICCVIFSQYTINDVLLKPGTVKIADYKTTHSKEIDRQLSRNICYINSQNKISDYKKDECLCIEKGKKNILLLGDSHSAHLSQSLRESFDKKNINLMQASVSGGFPLLKSQWSPRAKELMWFIFHDFIPKHSGEIGGVIISAHWYISIKENKSTSDLIADIQQTIAFLKHYSINSVVVGQSEVYNIPYVTIAAKEYERGVKISERYLDHQAYTINELLKRQLGEKYIDIINKGNIPRLSPNLVPYMFDQDHFTKYGADLATAKILQNPSMLKILSD